MSSFNRRDFLKTSVMGGLALVIPLKSKWDIFSIPQKKTVTSKVVLTTGNSRAEMAFQALKPFSEQVRKAIGKKQVIIKPNNVAIDIQLASTHVDTMEGILEFLESIGINGPVIIAESAANGATFDGFENFRYFDLTKKYKVKLVDLDAEKSELIYVFDEKDFRPHAVRTSSLILDPDTYVISSARMKTHDRVLATLSLKNIVVGAPVKDPGFAWGPQRKEGAKSDKAIIHGSGYRGINYNLYSLSKTLHPDLAVIDGYEGMEGNGPTQGTVVDHRICVASTDWFAADRVGVELMGINFADVGYLNYCADAGIGDPDISHYEIVGERIEDHIKKYRLSDSIQRQLIWKQPVK